MKLKNKVILITGSSQGIGKTLAFAMLQLGAKVCVNGRNLEKLQKLKQEWLEWNNDLTFVEADVSTNEGSERVIEKCLSRFGKLDIVICNAGMSAHGELEQTESGVIQEVLDSNIKAAALVAHFALPHILATKGSIVFISSVAGFHGIGGSSLYSAAKMAYTGLVQSLRKELNPKGVHVAIIYLGFVENEDSKKRLNQTGELEEVPSRARFKITSREKVAQLIVQSILKKKNKVIHSSLGKLTYLLNRISPALVHWMLQRAYIKEISSADE